MKNAPFAFLALLCALMPMNAQQPAQEHRLTEVEALRGENLARRVQAAQLQRALLERQWRDLIEEQRKAEADLAALEAQVLKRVGLDKGKASVDWSASVILQRPTSQAAPAAKPAVEAKPQ